MSRLAVRFPVPRSHSLPLAIAAVVAFGLSASAAADAPARGTVLVEHAWKDLDAGASAYAASTRPLLQGYFAWRGAGDAAAGTADWASLPPPLLSAVQAALADTATRNGLERGARSFADRLSRVVDPADTVFVVLLVGGFEEPLVSYDVGRRRVTAVALECFLVDWDGLDEELVEWARARRIWWPEITLQREEVFPWCAYAVTGVFAPELRQRRMGDVASLAETAVLQGFSTRLAAALYPDSRFSGAQPPVPAAARATLSAQWRDIGAAWFSFGTEPYLAAVYEPGVEAAVPQGTTVAQAAAVIGTELAGEWLRATRISRSQDEAAEIARLGRLPTLSVWGLLEP